MKPNVLLVIDSLNSGGAQNQLLYLAQGFVSRGMDVFLYTYHNELVFFDLNERAPQVIHLPSQIADKKQGFDFRIISELRTLLREHKIANVISFLESPSIYSALAKVGLNTRLVVSDRNSFAYFPAPKQATAALKRQVFRLADKVVSNSESQANWLRQKSLLNGVQTITNGYPPTGCAYKAPSPFNGSFNLVGFGRITKQKNIEFLAHELLQHPASIGPGLRLCVKWYGRVEDRAYYAEIKALASKVVANTEHELEFLPPTRKVNEVLNASHALVLPSHYEGFSNVLCETLMSGRLAFASAVSDNPVIVENGKFGGCIDTSVPGSLISGLMPFLESFQYYQDCCEFTYEHNHTRFDVEKMVEAYALLLK